MMKNMRTLTALLIVLALVLSACSAVQAVPPGSGDVLSLQSGTTLWGIQQALKEGHSTMILTDGGSKYLFVFNLKEAWGFAGLDSSTLNALKAKEIVPGNIVNGAGMSDIVTHLKDKGWQIVAAKQVPKVVTDFVTSAASGLTNAATSLTSFLFVPAGLFSPDELEGIMKGEIY